MTRSRVLALLRVNLLLAALGAFMGAAIAVPLTWLANLTTGFSGPIVFELFRLNMMAFGLLGLVVGPVLGWIALRRVPLWRAALEPALAAFIGATAGLFLMTNGSLWLLTAALGSGLAAWRLQRSHASDVLPAGMEDRALPERPTA